MHATDSIRHLYIHVPFCSGKCTYCILYSVMYEAAQAARYVDALAGEMDAFLREGPPLRPETIFVGGGTPSGLDAPLFERLLGHIRARIDTANLIEWTLEAQPGTLTPAKVAAMRAAGVNRVSVGVQSLNDATLKRVHRRHRVADVPASLDLCRAGGIENVGVDLIACLPGVSPEEWRATLRQASAYSLRHASVYALTIEPGSILESDVERGTFTPADDDTQVTELDAAESIFGETGLRRYEFSNYALPGRECLHNLAYWRGNDYIGFGPGASSRLRFNRWTNIKDVNRYVNAVEAGTAISRERDALSVRDDLTERLMFGFRLAEGVDLRLFAQHDTELAIHWATTLETLRSQGIVERLGGRWRLSASGRLYADSVAEALIPSD